MSFQVWVINAKLVETNGEGLAVGIQRQLIRYLAMLNFIKRIGMAISLVTVIQRIRINIG